MPTTASQVHTQDRLRAAPRWRRPPETAAVALGRLCLEAPRIGVGGVADPGVSDGHLALFEAVDRTQAAVSDGGAAAATPGA